MTGLGPHGDQPDEAQPHASHHREPAGQPVVATRAGRDADDPPGPGRGPSRRCRRRPPGPSRADDQGPRPGRPLHRPGRADPAARRRLPDPPTPPGPVSGAPREHPRTRRAGVDRPLQGSAGRRPGPAAGLPRARDRLPGRRDRPRRGSPGCRAGAERAAAAPAGRPAGDAGRAALRPAPGRVRQCVRGRNGSGPGRRAARDQPLGDRAGLPHHPLGSQRPDRGRRRRHDGPPPGDRPAGRPGAGAAARTGGAPGPRGEGGTPVADQLLARHDAAVRPGPAVACAAAEQRGGVRSRPWAKHDRRRPPGRARVELVPAVAHARPGGRTEVDPRPHGRLPPDRSAAGSRRPGLRPGRVPGRQHRRPRVPPERRLCGLGLHEPGTVPAAPCG